MKYLGQVLLFTLVLSFPAIACGQIAALKFTTEPQTVAPGVTSAKITVQTQDAAGNAQTLTDTAHLSLETSSASGEFSSSDTTWKAVTALTMSKSTANRSFYYKDSGAGTFSLTVKNADGFGWTPAVQAITIGNGGTTTTAGGTTTASTVEPESVAISIPNGYASSHSGQEELTLAKDEPAAIGAGRARLATVGSPLSFRAEKGTNYSSFNFEWSFGDGAEAMGERVSHVYLFPGEYQIVLRGFYAGKEAVSRTAVKVIEPKLVLSEVNWPAGYAELINESDSEINLYGWKLGCGPESFAFPRDTIVLDTARLKVPLYLTKCNSSSTDWRLSDSAGRVFARHDPSVDGQKVQVPSVSFSDSRRERVAAAIALARKQMARSFDPLAQAVSLPSLPSLPEKKTSSADQSAVIVLSDAPKPAAGWWRKLFSWTGL